MERNQKSDELLQTIQNAIAMYNELNPEEKITLLKDDGKRNVAGLFVCGYNGNRVGLFQKVDYVGPKKRSYKSNDWSYDAGEIYFGVDSSHVGIRLSHEGDLTVTEDMGWQRRGYAVNVMGKDYLVSCDMDFAMSFDDIRMRMYASEGLGNFERGKANSQEVMDVLACAQNYYIAKRSRRHH